MGLNTSFGTNTKLEHLMVVFTQTLLSTKCSCPQTHLCQPWALPAWLHFAVALQEAVWLSRVLLFLISNFSFPLIEAKLKEKKKKKRNKNQPLSSSCSFVCKSFELSAPNASPRNSFPV